MAGGRDEMKTIWLGNTKTGKSVIGGRVFVRLFEMKNFTAKNTISIPLRMEKPVRRPKVPPMTDNWVSAVFFMSLSMRS